MVKSKLACKINIDELKVNNYMLLLTIFVSNNVSNK